MYKMLTSHEPELRGFLQCFLLLKFSTLKFFRVRFFLKDLGWPFTGRPLGRCALQRHEGACRLSLGSLPRAVLPGSR